MRSTLAFVVVIALLVAAACQVGPSAPSSPPASASPVHASFVPMPPGTGFRHVTGGVEDTSVRPVDVSSSDVTGTMTLANGGTGLASVGSSLQYLRTNVGATALEFATPSWMDGDINSSAAIAVSKLAPGSSANVLTTTGGVPTWAAPALPTDLNISGEAQGDVLYFNGSNWVRLAAGTAGKFLQTNGASANPSWATVSTSPPLNWLPATWASNSGLSYTAGNYTAGVRFAPVRAGLVCTGMKFWAKNGTNATKNYKVRLVDHVAGSTLETQTATSVASGTLATVTWSGGGGPGGSWPLTSALGQTYGVSVYETSGTYYGKVAASPVELPGGSLVPFFWREGVTYLYNEYSAGDAIATTNTTMSEIYPVEPIFSP